MFPFMIYFAENHSYLDLYTLSLYLGPIWHVFRKIQMILGQENLRIFLEYFEAQNAVPLQTLVCWSICKI